ncbi:hypothetical protein JCM17843_23710 [Kordiimonadales bacterium JCM 17843]|nr:hypothetical protein JCM17843_23710 [Kordiimonadales bacterium JCM 17843]
MPSLMKKNLLACVSFVALAGSQAALAQSVDYGSLEMLFGEPVTTSATGKPQRSSEVPVPMEIVTADQISQTGATNIPDALRHVMGVDVIRWSTEGADVSVRGYNSPFNPRLLVLVNGRQVYADHFGMVFWNAIPVQMGEIRQIEVVKGPNTALFGFNAAIGVINIVTYNPMHDDVNDVRFTYGTQDTKEVSGLLTKRFENGGISMSGSYLDANAFNAGDEPRIIPDRDPSTGTFNLRGQFKLDAKSEIGFEGSWSSTKRAAFVPTFQASHPDVETFSARGSYLRDSSIGLIKANVYFNSLDHDTTVFGFGELAYQNDVLVAQVEDLFKIGTNHSFRLFGEYRHNTYKGEFGSNPFDEGVKANFDSFAASGMWDWTITDRLNFVGSGRLDVVDFSRSGFEVPGFPLTNEDFDRSLTEYTYNAGLVWRADEQTSVRFSAARGAKMMSLIEFAAAGMGPGPFPGTTFIEIGNPDLGASITESYDIGVERQIPALFSSLQANVFYTSLSKNVTVANFQPNFVAPPLFVSQPIDVGASEQIGVEVELEGAKDNLRWSANYSYIDVDDKFDLFTNGISPVGVDFERSTPKHKANAHLAIPLGPSTLISMPNISRNRIGSNKTPPVG